LQRIKQYEEDRRLYYVGMTRAKNELYLFNCRNTDSAFTSEVLRSLPREVVDADSVMAIFKQDLCDRNYTHKDEGKGTVIAQCGYTVLVEYENHKLQLLTFPQLFEQRDTTVTYESDPKNKSTKIQEGIDKKEKDLSAQEIEGLMMKVVVGEIATHNKFGKGIITKIDGDLITIRFDGATGDKKFLLKMSLQKGLLEI
jgi:DNA helicase-2/ATP-dependent DNA helicase PcrA